MGTIRDTMTRNRTGPMPDGPAKEWRDGPRMKKLEAKYGKYLWLPLDMPELKLRDPQKFVEWWDACSKPIDKLKEDVSGPANYGNGLFNAVSTDVQPDSLWSMNRRAEMPIMFPELFEHLHLFPFDGKVDFSIWSSNGKISAHRDATPLRDLPVAYRVMLLDENPKPTLHLEENIPDSNVDFKKLFRVPRIEGTNTFGWNNVRCVHMSSHDPRYRKHLLIVRNYTFNLDKFEDLMERSIAKYRDHCWISPLPQSAFVDG